MSTLEDITKRRTRQSVGEQQTAVPEPPASVAKPTGDQARARVEQGESGEAKTETAFNPVEEQKAYAKMLTHPAVAASSTAEPAPAAAAAPAAEPVTTYTDLAMKLNPELDAAEKKKREKQLRTKKQVAAIGDAISALANMHYTGRSGVNAYDPSSTLSAKAKANYDKYLAAVKDYEDKRKAALLSAEQADLKAAYQRAKDAKEQAGKDRSYSLALAKYQAEQAIAAAKAEREDALAMLEVQLKLGKIAEQEYNNKIAAINARYAEAVKQSEINKNNRTGIGADKPKYLAADKNGKVYSFASEAEADNFAKSEGTYEYDNYTETTTQVSPVFDITGQKTEETSTTTRKAERRGDGFRKVAASAYDATTSKGEKKPAYIVKGKGKGY